ncbi:uncharacterized protein LOC128395419 isoform X2 [Panonychus citri]|uniref:uncharacterized protein LOC128395419 isoform X2 n=1 Tax=Panonychus citri TaxID=50023 RepID=UPI00230715F7|nr:uncharacterized protein LOC128395419 isoform X2 [Panonychus citri]
MINMIGKKRSIRLSSLSLPVLQKNEIITPLVYNQVNLLGSLPGNLTNSYWKSSDSQHVGSQVLDSCLNSTDCRRSLAVIYLKTNGNRDCNSDGSIDCIDYALFAQFDSDCGSASKDTVNLTKFKINDCLNQGITSIHNIDQESGEVSIEYNATENDLESATEGGDSVRTIVPPVVTKLIGRECLKCICEASNNCDSNVTCDTSACGPYRLSFDYYQLAGSPGDGYENCCRDVDCSEKVIQTYVTKFLRDCDNNQLIDCDDFSAIHRFGSSCSNNQNKLSEYWRHFEYCTVMADNVRKEVDPWENSPRPSVNQPSLSLPPLIPYPVRFSTKAPINPPNRLINQIVHLDDQCLNCICQASSGCNITRTHCPNGSGCGPYQIDLTYVRDAGGELLTDDGFNDCANDRECSESIVKNYIERNVLDCNGDEILDCTDFALVHKLGRTNCRQSRDIDAFLDSAYWSEFQGCHGFD